MNLISLNRENQKYLMTMLKFFYKEHISIKHGQVVIFKKNRFSLFAKRKVSVMELCLSDLPYKILNLIPEHKKDEFSNKLNYHTILDIMLKSNDYISNDVDGIKYLWKIYTQFNEIKNPEGIIVKDSTQRINLFKYNPAYVITYLNAVYKDSRIKENKINFDKLKETILVKKRNLIDAFNIQTLNVNLSFR